MDRMNAAADRIWDARSLPELLDAACDAFEAMLNVIRLHDHPDDAECVSMVMTAASAGNGRDWLLFAPSLPPRRLAGDLRGHDDGRSPGDPTASAWLAGLCRAVDARLRSATSSAGLAGDRDSCLGAASCARQIADLMTGVPP